MKLLITGALGNLGTLCIEQALALGHEVKCVDIKTRKNKRRAQPFKNKVTIIWADIGTPGVAETIVDDVDAIIHNASLLPPATENHPELAERINVEGSKRLITAAEKSGRNPVFVFPSSVTVFGLPTTSSSEAPFPGTTPAPGTPKSTVASQTNILKTVRDPLVATDNYSRFKIAVERDLQQSALPWVVLRIGVSVDSRTLSTDKATFKQLLAVNANNPLEYVHPKDAALALCQAATQPKAIHKILLIGGGKSCQVTHRQFLSTAFSALGLALPKSIHGQNPYYTHWMDTRESQEILQFQQHSFPDYAGEMAQKLRWVKFLLLPFRPVLQALLHRLPRLL